MSDAQLQELPSGLRLRLSALPALFCFRSQSARSFLNLHAIFSFRFGILSLVMRVYSHLPVLLLLFIAEAVGEEESYSSFRFSIFFFLQKIINTSDMFFHHTATNSKTLVTNPSRNSVMGYYYRTVKSLIFPSVHLFNAYQDGW